jgi:hypothetical protein
MKRLACLLVLTFACLPACRPNALYIGAYDAGDVSCVNNGDCAAAGGSCCSHTCTNLKEDPANCGACGTVCSAVQACDQGNCVAVKQSSPDLSSGGNECGDHGGVCGVSCDNSSTYAQYSCGGDTLCCPPGTGSACESNGGQCLPTGSCPGSTYNQWSCQGGPGGPTCCPPTTTDGGQRNCPCLGSSDCDTGSACQQGVCVPGTLPACGGVGMACCGGFCGSCATPGVQCIQSVCITGP